MGNNLEILNKPHALVVIKNHLTKNEHKLYNVLLKKALSNIEAHAPIWFLSFKEMKEMSGITRNEDIKDALTGLKDKSITIKDVVLKGSEHRWAELNTSFISSWGRTEDESFLVFGFDPILFELLKQEYIYTRLNLRVMRGLNHKHALWLYEVISDYKYIGKRTLSIEEIRTLAGLEEGQYKTAAVLRRDVIDKAVKEIKNKTSFSISYTVEKEGRNVVGYTFKFKDNKADEIENKKRVREYFLNDTLYQTPKELKGLSLQVYSDNGDNGELLLFDYATKRPLSKADAFKAYEYMYERRHKIDENIDAKAYEWSLLK